METQIDLIENLRILLRYKWYLIIVFFISILLSYVVVYAFVDELYESSALVIPIDDNSTGSVASMMKNLKKLPVDFGGTASSNSDIAIYNTIIFSRTLAEDVIHKFELYRIYKVDTLKRGGKEDLLKVYRDIVKAGETDDLGYEVKSVTKDPKLSANIVNYILERLNLRIIQLKTSKSRLNRLFLENRYNDVKLDLTHVEDSLKRFQEKTGALAIEEQIKGTLLTLSTLEANLISKQIQQSIAKKIYLPDAPQLKSFDVEVEEINKKIYDIKTHNGQKGTLLSMTELPKTALDYLRIKRQVEIKTSILEFILPLYEQAKIEEQKDMPVMQVIDKAVPATKKCYPPRALYALLFSSFAECIAILFVIFNCKHKNVSRM